MCTKCKITKQLDEFHNSTKKPDGKHSHCKVCRLAYAASAQVRERENARRRALPKDHPFREQRRETERRRRYQKFGMSFEDYERMVKEAGGCQICGTPLTTERNAPRNQIACLDHCHDSGEPRGVLCLTCNSGIGKLKDDAELCRKAARYLDNFQKITTVEEL